jgi:pimeloyl-ACP methyl ester carboxylesterase
VEATQIGVAFLVQLILRFSLIVHKFVTVNLAVRSLFSIYNDKVALMKKTYAPKLKANHGHFVEIGSIELYYEEYGTGRPLLLLHGFGGCVQNWYPFIDELSLNYRLIVVDLRGHGHSTNPEHRFTHREAANDIFLLLEKLGVDRFSAIGMSSGGMILLHMATRQPLRINSMVLISATSHFPDQARTIMCSASFSTMPIEVKDMYQECAKRGDEQIHELIAQFNALGENYDDMNFTSQSLSTIMANTLVVHGDCDNFFPVDIPLGISSAIPKSELWIIRGGDHVPIYDLNVPFTSTALRFLEERATELP